MVGATGWTSRVNETRKRGCHRCGWTGRTAAMCETSAARPQPGVGSCVVVLSSGLTIWIGSPRPASPRCEPLAFGESSMCAADAGWTATPVRCRSCHDRGCSRRCGGRRLPCRQGPHRPVDRARSTTGRGTRSAHCGRLRADPSRGWGVPLNLLASTLRATLCHQNSTCPHRRRCWTCSPTSIPAMAAWPATSRPAGYRAAPLPGFAPDCLTDRHRPAGHRPGEPLPLSPPKSRPARA